MRRHIAIIIIALALPFLSSCSSASKGASATRSFFSDNLVFKKPVHPKEDRQPLRGNQWTLQQHARMQQKQRSIDNYYPNAKPWDTMPVGTKNFSKAPVHPSGRNHEYR